MLALPSPRQNFDLFFAHVRLGNANEQDDALEITAHRSFVTALTYLYERAKLRRFASPQETLICENFTNHFYVYASRPRPRPRPSDSARRVRSWNNADNDSREHSVKVIASRVRVFSLCKIIISRIENIHSRAHLCTTVRPRTRKNWTTICPLCVGPGENCEHVTRSCLNRTEDLIWTPIGDKLWSLFLSDNWLENGRYWQGCHFLENLEKSGKV